MGLPEMLVEFKEKGSSAIERSGRGTVAIVLKDDTNDVDTHYFSNLAEVKAVDWSAENYAHIARTFKGNPADVIVERIESAAVDYSAALERLTVRKFNWFAIPGIASDDVAAISSWVTDQFDAKHKKFGALLPSSVSDHQAIINCTTGGIVTAEGTFTASDYTCRYAGIFASVPLNQSATYKVLDEVIEITNHSDPDADIDAGELILINDGEKVKIGRAVTSLTTVTESRPKGFKKVKIFDASNLLATDIRTTFADHYVGQVNNDYDDKVQFFAAANVYLGQLVRDGALSSTGENKVGIDMIKQMDYITLQGDDPKLMKEKEIKEYQTGSKVFANVKVKYTDAMEDLEFGVES